MQRSSSLQRLRQAGANTPSWIKRLLRPVARRVKLVSEPGAWVEPRKGGSTGRWLADDVACCNVCSWSGAAFAGPAHVEAADCPRCGSVARDRFLLWCAGRSTALTDGTRVLETSPRMGVAYREMMRRHFRYQASDYDLGAHRADIRIDLQDIDLPDAALDVVLSAHVLEHVPDTAKALAELHRVIAPGGSVFVQVPLLHGTTAPPIEPEYHGDGTLVFWRFGWDLTEMLRAAGFETRALVTAEFAAMLRGDAPVPTPDGDIFDVADLVRHARTADLEVVADSTVAARLGWRPSHQFVTWEGRRT